MKKNVDMYPPAETCGNEEMTMVTERLMKKIVLSSKRKYVTMGWTMTLTERLMLQMKMIVL